MPSVGSRSGGCIREIGRTSRKREASPLSSLPTLTRQLDQRAHKNMDGLLYYMCLKELRETKPTLLGFIMPGLH